MAHFKSYVICTSPRSGSTLLCKMLGNTGNAGVPGSHFHEPSLSKWLSDYGLDPDNYSTQQETLQAVFASAIERGKGETDVFGLRLQRHSFGFFMRQLAVLLPETTLEKERLSSAFGTTLFIHLSRENKLDQAISYVKATQTGLWHAAPDGTELERLSEPKEPNYNAQAISKVLSDFVAMDCDWKTWFDTQQIEPLKITYEDLSHDPQATLARVLERLGLEFEPRTGDDLPVAKLADATNKDWSDRFISEMSEIDS
ncbi:Stf0 family sulfotransferase [Parasedimentitalea huanghaiensis]|uniref:Sulfotransferase n=1 Tax=Parasedimentitalea huanghaiensis TaxID=2682100 RepID=A0A6L6WJJ8_9RHOB|nr:Stf0 family sulfotransferase [Zongyanglinia huanghaiensis]MVO15892.1 sulfotransferase [Zongyanglinia huanghaiensis]